MCELLKLQRSLTKAIVASSIGKEIIQTLARTPHFSEVQTDSLGNIFCHIRGKGKRVLLVTHPYFDTCMVSHIDENGFLCLSRIGRIKPACLLNTRMRFYNGIKGVVRIRDMNESYKKSACSLSWSELFMDIGTCSKTETEALVHPGDLCYFDREPHLAAGGNIIGPYASGLLGCIVLLQILKQILDTTVDLHVLFATSGKTASIASLIRQIEPDISIAVTSATAYDTPEHDKLHSALALGLGAAIRINGVDTIPSPILITQLKETAHCHQILIQNEILQTCETDTYMTAMDSSRLFDAHIGIPLRHSHTPSEIYSISDVHSAVDLLTAFVQQVQ